MTHNQLDYLERLARRLPAEDWQVSGDGFGVVAPRDGYNLKRLYCHDAALAAYAAELSPGAVLELLALARRGLAVA